MSASHVTLGELRLSVQQAFFGLAALRPADDTAHRTAMRDLIDETVHDLALTVIGEQGEILTGADVDELVDGAIAEVVNFQPGAPAPEDDDA